MTAVWLNDDLLVSPSAVAGLTYRLERDGDGVPHTHVISMIWVSGASATELARLSMNSTREEALAEMARLSELLWRSELPPLRLNTLPDIRIYDPELYGLAVCTVVTVDGERMCDLADGHPGAHRFGRPWPTATISDSSP